MNQNLQKKPKRKVVNVVTNQVRVKKKQKIRDVNGEDKSNNVDRISELPEPIIHDILSFLQCPKDVVRTSVLSKRWKNIWASFLTFDFDQRSFKSEGENRETFENFIERSLSRRMAPLVCIHKFRLCFTSFNPNLAYQVDRWLRAATAKDVKELEIYVETKGLQYTLPQTVLAAEKLTSLKLYGCKLDNCFDIKLSNLQQLSIKKVRVDVKIIRSFFHSCPWIEDLRLIHCTGMHSLCISALIKLSRVEVHECHGLKYVQINVPNLQTFWFYGKRSIRYNINLEGCKELKSLTLKDTNMTDELFHNHFFMFPVLEKLILKECNTLKRITILSEKLKRLALIRCKNLLGANIDAPSLHSFEYTNNQMPFFSMNTPKLQEAKLYFEWNRSGLHKIFWLNTLFLGKLNQSKNLKLVVRHEKDVIVSEELRDIQLLPFKHLKLEIINSSTSLEGHLDSLLQTRPKTISVLSPSDSETLKLLYEKMIMNRKENPSCCRYYFRKCWLHYLKDVTFENEWINTRIPWERSSSSLHPSTTFKLEWTQG